MQADKLSEDEEHDDERLDRELAQYPAYNIDFIYEMCGGDVCPKCGGHLTYKDTVVRIDGKRGEVLELAGKDVSIPLYHPSCYKERMQEKWSQDMTSLDDFYSEEIDPEETSWGGEEE